MKDTNDKLKNRLLEIESLLKELTKENQEHLFTWSGFRERSDRIETLLESRRDILNQLFIPNPENINRLKEVNEYLYNLSLKLHHRVNRMASRKMDWLDEPEFDDSFNLEGNLIYHYEDEESVLKFEDDSYYGSDFSSMIEIIYEFHDRHSRAIEQFYPDSELLDDGESWNEHPFHDKAFDGIIICHAVHDLCDHKLYSIPDLLRLNNFWAEVNLTVQSITNQNGFRFKDTY